MLNGTQKWNARLYSCKYLYSQNAILMGFVNNVQVEIVGTELVNNVQILRPSSTL